MKPYLGYVKMETKPEVVITEKYIAELQDNIVWARKNMKMAEREFEATKEAHNAAKNLCTVLDANQFASESHLADILLQKLTRAIEWKEMEFINASEIYQDFQSDMAEVELHNKEQSDNKF